MADRPSLLLVGHGSRSAAGVAAYWDFAAVLGNEAPNLDIGCGFIELAEPDLDTAIDRLVAGGATSVVAVPLVLLGAGHLKNDGPLFAYFGLLPHELGRRDKTRAQGWSPPRITSCSSRHRR